MVTGCWGRPSSITLHENVTVTTQIYQKTTKTNYAYTHNYLTTKYLLHYHDVTPKTITFFIQLKQLQIQIKVEFYKRNCLSRLQLLLSI